MEHRLSSLNHVANKKCLSVISAVHSLLVSRKGNMAASAAALAASTVQKFRVTLTTSAGETIEWRELVTTPPIKRRLRDVLSDIGAPVPPNFTESDIRLKRPDGLMIIGLVDMTYAAQEGVSTIHATVGGPLNISVNLHHPHRPGTAL